MGEEGAQRAYPRRAGGGNRTRGPGGRPRMTRAKIVGVGAYAPKRILSNADLEKMVETNDEWIVQRSGIRERHIADETEATSDLAVKAAQQALERANLVPEDVDFIAVGTTTPDMIFPTVGNIVQHRLGCRRAGSVDLLAACAGSIYSLSIGSQFIQTGKYRRVLCIGAETLSRITDFTDRGTCVLLADAAGAAVLEPSDDERGILFFSSRRRHTSLQGDWSSDVCSSDLEADRRGNRPVPQARAGARRRDAG